MLDKKRVRTCFALLAFSSTTGFLQAAISPSRLEANFGIFPVDIYTTPQYTDIFPGASCHTTGGTTPQSCVQQVLANWQNQGVTGVRFQFALGNGQWEPPTSSTGPFYPSYSTPFLAGGSLNPAWNSNLQAFFVDVKAAGISNVSVYPVMAWYWSGWNNSTFQTSMIIPDPCKGIERRHPTQQYYFYPWLPFGLVPSTIFPAFWPEEDIDNAYNCTPANPGFWGWTPYLNLVAEIAGDARDAGLNLEEFEVEAELDFEHFTSTARLVYDNTTSTPVRTQVGGILASYGFSSGAATYSTATAYPTATPMGWDCLSLYGDSAMLITSSELLASMGGAVLGVPAGVSDPNGLDCGGSISPTMITIPSQSIYGMTDNHSYPCIGSCSTSPDVTGLAESIFSDIMSFYTYRGLGSDTAMIGETSSNSPPSYPCDGTTSAQAFENASGYTMSSLNSSHGSLTVIRPWDWITSASSSLCETPGSIGAPSGPYIP